MKSSASKIQITGFDDLFQAGVEAEANSEQVQKVPLAEMFPFKNHPFYVRDDEAMQETADSIAKYGVLVPGIVRPRQEGGYEIVAGHRRKQGSELAGKATMPVLVRALDDDEATIIMVDSNLQREKILPNEKAFAYKMKLDAIKHHGKRNDLTLVRGRAFDKEAGFKYIKACKEEKRRLMASSQVFYHSLEVQGRGGKEAVVLRCL